MPVRRSLALLLIALIALAIGQGPASAVLHAQSGPAPLVITTPTPILPTVTPAPRPTVAPSQGPHVPGAEQSLTAFDGMHAHSAGYQTYTVREGDTLLSVALEVGLDLEDAYCLLYPSFTWDQPLVIGDLLSVPAPGTFCHAVEIGETILSIAEEYQRSPAAILADPWNELIDPLGDRRALTVGHHLRIPPDPGESVDAVDGPQLDYVEGVLPLILKQGVNADIDQVVAVGKVFSQGEAPAVGGVGRVVDTPVPSDWPYGSGQFSWPIYGWLTQGYKADHRAVDVAAPVGTVVTAADRGVVIRAGWNDQGYGMFVIVDHNIDYITLYAHLSEVLVEEGEIVAAGQVLGRVGSTGNSTGPHLHFEIRDFGRRSDPLTLLMP